MKTKALIFLLMITIGCSQSQEKDKIAKSPEIIISKSYGSDSERKWIENDEIKCIISQVIDGASSASDIYIRFIPMSSNTIEIRNITGIMNWEQEGKIKPSSFILSHINPIIEKNERADNFLFYNIKFSDSTYKSIPFEVNKVIVELQFDLIIDQKIKHYKKEVTFEQVIHENPIPSGRND